MFFGAGIIVTVQTQAISGQDALGNDVKTWTDISVSNVGFAPGGSVERVQGQDQVTYKPTVYLPAGTVITAYSRVIVAGVTYEVDGSPTEWVDPFTGYDFGIVANLKDVTG